SVGAVSDSRLAEVGGDVVELPPSDAEEERVGRTDGDGRRVARVSGDVRSLSVDVHLRMDERAESDRRGRSGAGNGLRGRQGRIVGPLHMLELFQRGGAVDLFLSQSRGGNEERGGRDDDWERGKRESHGELS